MSSSYSSSPSPSLPPTTTLPPALANETTTTDLPTTALEDVGPSIPEIKPRPYQLEMLQESLERNIIVAVSFLFGEAGRLFPSTRLNILGVVIDGYRKWEDVYVSLGLFVLSS